MAAIMKGKTMTSKRMYDGTNRKARSLAVQRRRKQVEQAYIYTSIAILSGGVGVWLGIVAANWRV